MRFNSLMYMTNAVAMGKLQSRQKSKSSGIEPEGGAARPPKMSVFTSRQGVTTQKTWIFINNHVSLICFFFNNLDWGPVPYFVPWKHCSQCGLLYIPVTFSKRSCSGRQVPPTSTTRGSPLAAKGGTMGEKWWLGYAPRVLLHAANLRHGTDNFTSLPKEDVLRIFITL